MWMENMKIHMSIIMYMVGTVSEVMSICLPTVFGNRSFK